MMAQDATPISPGFGRTPMARAGRRWRPLSPMLAGARARRIRWRFRCDDYQARRRSRRARQGSRISITTMHAFMRTAQAANNIFRYVELKFFARSPAIVGHGSLFTVAYRFRRPAMIFFASAFRQGRDYTPIISINAAAMSYLPSRHAHLRAGRGHSRASPCIAAGRAGQAGWPLGRRGIVARRAISISRFLTHDFAA